MLAGILFCEARCFVIFYCWRNQCFFAVFGWEALVKNCRFLTLFGFLPSLRPAWRCPTVFLAGWKICLWMSFFFSFFFSSLLNILEFLKNFNLFPLSNAFERQILTYNSIEFFFTNKVVSIVLFFKAEFIDVCVPSSTIYYSRLAKIKEDGWLYNRRYRKVHCFASFWICPVCLIPLP